MEGRTRGLAVAVLVLTVLVSASATTLLSGTLITYSTDKYPSEGITVKYASSNPAIPSYIIGSPEPRVRVVDLAGRSIAGVVVNVFAGMPGARIAYLGRVAGDDGSAVLTPQHIEED